MSENLANINDRVIRDMSEGLIVVERGGDMHVMNKTACDILERSREELEGQNFAAVFFDDDRNDMFTQAILNVVYDSKKERRIVTSYFAGDKRKYLNVFTSGLSDDDGKITGIIVILSDITELMQIRRHLQMMHRIQELNRELEKRNEFLRYAFGRYLSDEVVEKILNSPDGLSIGGSLSDVTILMSDLRGFTAICEQMEPAPLIRMLNHYLDHMARIIREMKGTVIEYIGDGILAIFGDPVKLVNHAETAVHTAVLMQREMETINDWNRKEGYPELKMGIGINSGETVVGNMGSEHAVRYNAIGSSVNLCGRIESYTAGGKIYISAETRSRIQSELITDNCFRAEPKGVKGGVTIYSVKGFGDPYYITYELPEEEIRDLKEKEPVILKVLKGKDISDQEEAAAVLGRSSSRVRFAADRELDLMTDVLLQNRQNMRCYGKIIEKEESTGRETGESPDRQGEDFLRNIYIMDITGMD